MSDFLQPQTRARRRPWLAILIGLLVFWFVSRPAGAPPGWGGDFDMAVKAAAEQSKFVLVAFHSENCPPCVAMDRTVLRADVIQKALSDFVPVRVDVARDQRVAGMFGVFATPTYAVLSPEGKLLAQTQGFQSEEEMLQFFQTAKESAKQ